MFAPPGVELPMTAFADMCKDYRGCFPKWASKVHAIEDNGDGTFSVQTQKFLGTVTGDIPAIGPFPAVAFADMPEPCKTTDIILPIEIGQYTFADDGRLQKALYTGELGDEAGATTMHISPPVGMLCLYQLAGLSLDQLTPPPPSAADASSAGSEIVARAVAAAAAASVAAAPSKFDRWDNQFTRRAQVTKKDNQSLGISVEENVDGGYCFLHSFKEEGAVPDAGVFREGDIILAINDTYVQGMEHGELVNVLIGAFPSFSVTTINESEASCLGQGMSTVTVTKGDSWGILAFADKASDVPGIVVEGVKEGIQLAGGTLNKGDRVVLVNGNDAGDASMDAFVALLGANGDQATLVVQSAKAAAASGDSHADASLKPVQRKGSTAVATTTMVIVNRGDNNKSLGIALLGDGAHTGHHVAHVVAGGPADKAGVKIGTEVQAVGDKDISKLSHDEVVKMLADAGDAVKLTLSLSTNDFAEFTTVSFSRVKGSFGFKIIDQSDCDYVRVFEVIQGGAAATAGKVTVGDRLIAINHEDLNGIDYAGVVEVLGKTDGIVDFSFQSDSMPLAMPPVLH